MIPATVSPIAAAEFVARAVSGMRGVQARAWAPASGAMQSRVYVTLTDKRNGGRHWNRGIAAAFCFDLIGEERTQTQQWAGASTRDVNVDLLNRVTDAIWAAHDALIAVYAPVATGAVEVSGDLEVSGADRDHCEN